jgi:UPF0755 protein
MSERLDESIFGGGDVADERGRYHRTERPRRRRGGVARRWLALLVALAIFVGGAYLAKQFVEPIWNRITTSGDIDFPGPGEGEVKIVIKKGEDGEVIATTLKSAGVVKTRTAYLDVVRANPQKAAAIQAGTYTMKKGMTAKDAFSFIVDPANRVGSGITVREGLWASEIYPILSKATGVPLAEYQKAAADPKALGLPAAANGKVEGWLFPSTYEFPDKASATVQLRTMVAKAVAEMKKSGVPQADWERTMALASIVEAEARLDVDRPKIARVFLNRIANTGKAPTYGLFQSDASLAYGLKKRVINLTQSELADRTNPYNLRFKPGLPPTPISNPGAKSIEAVAKPATGTWLFFVATNPDTGETKYATTVAEHEANVAEFQAWCRENADKC